LQAGKSIAETGCTVSPSQVGVALSLIFMRRLGGASEGFLLPKGITRGREGKTCAPGRGNLPPGNIAEKRVSQRSGPASARESRAKLWPASLIGERCRLSRHMLMWRAVLQRGDNMGRTQVWWGVAVVAVVSVAGFVPLLLARTEPADPVPGAREPVPGTKVVSFKLYFDERAQFPQTIRQSTMERLLGPGYELVESTASRGSQSGETGTTSVGGRDCTLEHDGGVISLRVPESAKSADIVSKLERLGRIRLVRSY
jgi:hypothetical protein